MQRLTLGNSGGPLIYPNGEVVGINTVKISTAEGIGFAIPINVVKPIIKSFQETGEFTQATIGIYAYDKEVIPYLDQKVSFKQGIYVAQITEKGPASQTELKEGDIILSIDGKELNTMNDLREYVYQKKPDDEVTLRISRGKINREIKVILGKK
jgi:S1-C subfamily serine protease